MSYHTRRARLLTDLVSLLRDGYVAFLKELGAKMGFTVEADISQRVFEDQRAVELLLRVKIT